MPEKTIKIAKLEKFCTLSPVRCAYFAEAACVCLEKLGHLPTIEIMVRGDVVGKATLDWDRLEPVVFDSWTNLEEAVEHAAYGVSLPLIWEFTDFQIVKQSSKGSGIDFWLANKKDDFPFQEAFKLEVSGILRGSMGQVNTRVKQKIGQATSGKEPSKLIIVIVVEFSRPFAKIIF